MLEVIVAIFMLSASAVLLALTVYLIQEIKR